MPVSFGNLREPQPDFSATSFSTPLMRAGSRSASDRKSTRLNSSHLVISYAVFCLTNTNTSRKPYVPLFKSHGSDKHRDIYYHTKNLGLLIHCQTFCMRPTHMRPYQTMFQPVIYSI